MQDPRVERLPCLHSGTYADDCICERVRQHRCYIVATCDRDLRRRLRKVNLKDFSATVWVTSPLHWECRVRGLGLALARACELDGEGSSWLAFKVLSLTLSEVCHSPKHSHRWLRTVHIAICKELSGPCFGSALISSVSCRSLACLSCIYKRTSTQ